MSGRRMHSIGLLGQYEAGIPVDENLFFQSHLLRYLIRESGKLENHTS